MSMQRGVRTEGFSVGYGKHIVVRDISLAVEPGRILTLTGPNGSGKSTILKTITRQLEMLGGAVYLDGTSMAHMKQIDIARSMSMVMTDRVRTELMTCREVVATGRYPYTGRFGILSEADWDEVEQAMKLVCADEVADQNFQKISDGQKQRVMLARAICQNTRVMILDEPTSYLDMRYKLDILGNIRKMAREKQIAVVMSLHELDLAQKISDYVACVDGDQIDKWGTPEEIFQGDYIQQLYGIPESCFDPMLGTMQFPGNPNPPEVFVIGGGGAGIPVYQRLQREDRPFAAGIFAANDMEYPFAKATAGIFVSTEAFCPIEEVHMKQAKALIDECRTCICAVKTFGPYNRRNLELRNYAYEQGKLQE